MKKLFLILLLLPLFGMSQNSNTSIYQISTLSNDPLYRKQFNTYNEDMDRSNKLLSNVKVKVEKPEAPRPIKPFTKEKLKKLYDKNHKEPTMVNNSCCCDYNRPPRTIWWDGSFEVQRRIVIVH